MITNVFGAKCIGIDAVPVTVEVDITNGIGIHLVGLADAAVKESLLRTVTALQSLGFRIPGKKIVINLAPADMRKKGSGYDLPIALGIIAASDQSEIPHIGEYLIMGELGLDGTVRSVPGALPMVELAGKRGFRGCILPYASAKETVELGGTKIYGVYTLMDAVEILKEDGERERFLMRARGRSEAGTAIDQSVMDFADIIGQEGAKRGLEIAAAGGHNALLIGPPGAGKSSLSRATANILPPLTTAEALQTSKIYSVAGKGDLRGGLIRRRPFRCPHYSASVAALIGGGSDNIIPGEISLAHNGVLFLDEFCEIPKKVTEALRGPMEDRMVTVSRLKTKIEYPADFMLIAATNPCPCGYYGEGDRCTCTPARRQAYLSRLSGPLMDRIDIHLWMKPVDAGTLIRRPKAESSAEVALRVARARQIQTLRFTGTDNFTNASMSRQQIDTFCALSPACNDFLEKTINTAGLSARAYHRILKLARTIADLEAAANPSLWEPGPAIPTNPTSQIGPTCPTGSTRQFDPTSPSGPFDPAPQPADNRTTRLRADAVIPEIALRHISEAVGYRFLDKRDIIL